MSMAAPQPSAKVLYTKQENEKIIFVLQICCEQSPLFLEIQIDR